MNRLGNRNAAAPFEERPQVLSLDKFEGDEMEALVLAAEKHAGNVLVVEFGGSSCLLMEAANVFHVRGHFRRQNFERHRAVELGIPRSDDRGHTSDTDR